MELFFELFVTFFFDVYSYMNTNSLSFREINYVEAFKEYEYELLPNSEELTSTINEWGSHARINSYNNNEDDHEE
jgi:hypothetical protein